MLNRIAHFSGIVLLIVHFALSDTYGQERRSSVLANGDWYKLAVTEEGIYKIDASMLAEIGINIQSIDPRNIHIHGNGGKMLPQPNSAHRLEDLQENAIWVEGEADGQFNSGDFILFYGQGPDTFVFDTLNKEISYTNHVYSDTSFYFLKIDSNPGKRIENSANEGNEFPGISDFIHYKVYEKDLVYLLKPGSGREWYENIFSSSTKSRSFEFEFPNVVADKPISAMSHVLANSRNPSRIEVLINDLTAGQHEIGSVPNTTYSQRARESIENFKVDNIEDPAEDKIIVTLNFDGEGTGYLNYIMVSASRSLILEDSALFFRSWESLDNSQSTFTIEGVSANTRVWDITDPLNILSQEVSFSGSQIQFGTGTSSLKQFVAFEPGTLMVPHIIGRVDNQDLQGNTAANMVIVTYPDFISEANRLADLRRSKDNISVAVVSINEVYNEFSSGSQDITAIRDFMKYLWDIDNSETGLQHLLLFGKSSFDYKDRLQGNTNFVPTYESYNSLHPIYSYSSDDYFGFLEDNEGAWNESSNGDHTLEIGVGRIPVKDISESRTVVDKYYTYSLDENTLGAWKNNLAFVADDGDNNLHQRQADRLADTVERYDEVFNKKKIYLDAFEQVTIPGGETSQEAYDYINRTVNDGTLILNFTGHGGERQWTDERILDFLMIEDWENEFKMPVFITATCEFGRHDTPEIISGAERTLLREKGGAIALVTTARPVFATQNFELNNAFYNALLNTSSEGTPRLGHVFKETKNNSLSGSVNRNFALLGDPSMKLAIPGLRAEIDSITNSLGIATDTLNALSEITIHGSIRNLSKSLVSDFSGEVNITLFEKPSNKTTIGSKEEPFEYLERDNIIFKGKATVTEGRFSADLIIPKNISYQYGHGKFSLYAFSTSDMQDARGSSQDIVIGGSKTPLNIDTTPPEITAYLGDSTFLPGGTIKPNTLLVARLYDESGISISRSGLGQNIHAVLDNNEVFYLNDYYESDLDTYKSGWVRFPIEGLETGPHTVTIKAWDVFNNSSESVIDFNVSEKGALVLNHLRNYPNPFKESTSFTFEHNRPGEDLEIELQIYNNNGGIVKQLEWDITGSMAKTMGLEWNGRNSSGAKLRPGIYFYKMLVRSISDGASDLLYQKLIIY